ncbi:MAG: flagellar biosynthesis protein FlhB [Candidatus Eisenbacteria bacterium]
MSEDSGGQERTEAPTPRRRQQAREEGKVARSPELNAAIGILGGALLLSAAGGPPIYAFAVQFTHDSAARLAADPLTAAGAVDIVRSLGFGFARAILPFLVGLTLIVLAVSAWQARGVLTLKPLQPNFSLLDPIAGFKRIASVESLFTLAKSLVKLTILGLLTYVMIRRSWPELMSLSESGPHEIALVIRSLLLRLAVLVGFAFLAIAFFDYAFQHWRMEKSLRMTRQEVIYEHRESEGDPLVKSRIRSMMRAEARRRMLQQVKLADVVVTNPTRIAVALKYDPAKAAAPIVVAMGQRKLAERIRALANDARVPIVENKPVARALLATGKIGKPIPPALYAAVAEILAYVYRQRGGLRSMREAIARSAGSAASGAAGAGARATV